MSTASCLAVAVNCQTATASRLTAIAIGCHQTATAQKALKMSEGVAAGATEGDTEEGNGPNQTKSVGESHVLFEMKGSSRKEWNYVRLVAKDELRTKKNLKSTDAAKAYCLLCKSYITYSKGNGNSVYRHMEKRHQHVIEKAKATDDTQPLKKKQKTLENHFSNIIKEQNMRLASREDRLLGDALLVKWTSKCLRPFKIVEDSGFKEFCAFLNQLRSRYELPSRNKHRYQMMKLAECVMNKVKEGIKEELEYYSITTDIWSSRVMQSFMAVTLHYLTEAFDMKTFVIEVATLKGSHTGEFIAGCLRKTLSTFNLRNQKLALLLRDNASNGIKACEDMEVPHFGCIGHSLHLVVGPFLLEKKKAQDTQESMVDDDDDDIAEFELIEDDMSEEIVNRVCKVVSKFRKVAKYVKNSPKAKEKIEHFDAMAKSNNRDTIHVSLDVRTRWNSVLD